MLNWRGPLLAAAVFASVFGILLLMAHLNQSKTSDEGSSFRQDPYGTSLLFDSYERAGYKVKRSQDENSLADQDATRTTALFIGGYDYGDVETRDGKIVRGGKFHGLLEDFLGRGGRAVLLQREPGLCRQIFAGDECAFGIHAARAASCVHEALVDALAALARHARVSQPTCQRKSVKRGVGLVDDERFKSNELVHSG